MKYDNFGYCYKNSVRCDNRESAIVTSVGFISRSEEVKLFSIYEYQNIEYNAVLGSSDVLVGLLGSNIVRVYSKGNQVHTMEQGFYEKRSCLGKTVHVHRINGFQYVCFFDGPELTWTAFSGNVLIQEKDYHENILRSFF